MFSAIVGIIGAGIAVGTSVAGGVRSRKNARNQQRIVDRKGEYQDELDRMDRKLANRGRRQKRTALDFDIKEADRRNAMGKEKIQHGQNLMQVGATRDFQSAMGKGTDKGLDKLDHQSTILGLM